MVLQRRRRLARRRKAAGLTQERLAELLRVDRTTVGRWETGETEPRPYVRPKLARLLGLSIAELADVLEVMSEDVSTFPRGSVVAAGSANRCSQDADALTHDLLTQISSSESVAMDGVCANGGAVAARGAGTGDHRGQRDLDRETDGVSLALPAGRSFAGVLVPTMKAGATDDGRILVDLPPDSSADPAFHRPGRALLIGVTPDGTRYGMDARSVRRRLSRSADSSRLLLPRAYALDELTMAALWATANLDQALLDDDATLSEYDSHLGQYSHTVRSAGGHEIADELTPVSRMWLGSNFCARHIFRHMSDLRGAPAFWTCEQRGEEASTWLFFGHKLDYLERTAATRSRAFCVPRPVAESSAPVERILLLLAIALIESFEIRVDICAEPEYQAIPGHVLGPARRAIVANWVGAAGVWQVDVTDSRPSVRDFNDAVGFAGAHSVSSGEAPGDRLRQAAEYLNIEWSWLISRCRELGEYGVHDLVMPRSRHLSVEGFDRACRFVAATVRTARKVGGPSSPTS